MDTFCRKGTFERTTVEVNLALGLAIAVFVLHCRRRGGQARGSAEDAVHQFGAFAGEELLEALYCFRLARSALRMSLRAGWMTYDRKYTSHVASNGSIELLLGWVFDDFLDVVVFREKRIFAVLRNPWVFLLLSAFCAPTPYTETYPDLSHGDTLLRVLL